MVLRVVDRLGHLINDELMRRQVRIAHAQVDHILPRRQKRPLLLVDLNEQIRRQGLQTLCLCESHRSSSRKKTRAREFTKNSASEIAPAAVLDPLHNCDILTL